MQRKILVFTIVACGVAISSLIFLAPHYFGGQFFQNHDIEEISTKTYQNIQKDEDFMNGDRLFALGDKEGARVSFEKSLQKVKPDSNDEGQVKFKLAASYAPTDLVKAVGLFKEVAENTNYAPITRAYAVQTMAELFLDFANKTDTLDKIIFSGDPYQSFRLGSSLKEAQTQLYEYGASIYPLVLTSMRLANTYNLRISSTTEPVEFLELREKIEKNLMAADADIVRLQKDQLPNTYFYIPRSLVIKANILASWELRNDDSLRTYGNAEETFLKAIEMSDKGSAGDAVEAYAKYHYAVFLSKKYGVERGEDIKNLLAGVYLDNRKIRESTLVKTMVTEKNNVLGAKENLVRLATIDPAFKDFLISLGWEDADFQ